MYVTLEVVSPQAASLGADRRRVVSERGLTIGRVHGNDWIIPDPYISKQHARISFSNGAFFVEGLGRNAIAIGSPASPLPTHRRQALRNGDHLFIDQYEMIVTIQQGDPPGMSQAASDDPFAVLPPPPGAAAEASRSTVPNKWNPIEDLADNGLIDPMEALGGNARSREPEPLPPINVHGSPVIADHFSPPPVPSSSGSPFDLLGPGADESPVVPAPQAGGIPDNWDRTNMTNLSFRPPPEPPKPAPRQVTPPRVVRPPGRDPPAPRPVAPAPARVAPATSHAVRQQLPDRPPIPDQRPPVPESRLTSTAPEELAQLMRGAGLTGQDMSPETLQELGKVLRIVVTGVMEVLRARAQIKSQFRMPTTQIQQAENNPLKHSPNVEHALHTLLVQRNPGFLSTVQAFEDAFADIRNHQMAMLEGLRVAFDSMLESFDPKELEKGFERAAKRGFGSAKSKYWDLYVERFAELGADADDTFRRLFGDAFAEAYEKQLKRLKSLPRNTGKS